MAGTVEPAGGFQSASEAGVTPSPGDPGIPASEPVHDHVALLQRIWGPAERGETE
jgi:hypothetical protein